MNRGDRVTGSRKLHLADHHPELRGRRIPPDAVQVDIVKLASVQEQFCLVVDSYHLGPILYNCFAIT